MRLAVSSQGPYPRRAAERSAERFRLIDQRLSAAQVEVGEQIGPWHLYRLTLHTAVGVATAEPHGATRWDFAH